MSTKEKAERDDAKRDVVRGTGLEDETVLSDRMEGRAR
jgi:hypothetical protein